MLMPWVILLVVCTTLDLADFLLTLLGEVSN